MQERAKFTHSFNLHVMSIIRLLLAVFGAGLGLTLALPVLAIAAPFWMVAVLTRHLAPLCRPAVVRWPELFEFDRELGWRAKANFSGHCLEERDDVFAVKTDRDGWPCTTTLAESRVVVIGDSYAFGYGVDPNKAFFAARQGSVIKAVGAPGYNMVQEVLLMERLAADLQGKIVVWFIYFGNDLYDNITPEMSGYRSPFVAQDGKGGWKIVRSHLSPQKWVCSMGRGGKHGARVTEQLFQVSPLSERAFSACEWLIARGSNICTAAGATLVVMTIPHPMLLSRSASGRRAIADPSYPDDKVRAICGKLDVACICLRETLTREDYKDLDEHWNERGHRKVGQILRRLVQTSAATEPEPTRDERLILAGSR